MSEIVFVTGASGFLGTHIIDLLLDGGYRVRGAARGAKLAAIRKAYASYGDKFEAIDVPDIAHTQFPEALEGIHALIHTAAPIYERSDAEGLQKGIVDGTLNVVRQAAKAGVKHIIYSSSAITVMNPNMTWTDKDWSPMTIEEALKGSNLDVYRACKTVAERELWAFADANPDIEVTSFNPPYLYGPFARGFTAQPGDYLGLSTNVLIYRFLTPAGACPSNPGYVDVRDAARAHVRALTAPSTATVGRKRFPFASPHGLDFQAVLDLIAEKRPELRERLLGSDKIRRFPFDRLPVDFARVEEVLGIAKGDYYTVEDTILGTVDNLLKIEEEWKSQGLTIDIPPPEAGEFDA